MSTVAPTKGRRRTQGSAMPPGSAQDLQNIRDLNAQTNPQASDSEMGYPVQPTTPPRTPRRGERSRPASQLESTTSAPESGSKQKSRNKNRPMNVLTSPAVVLNGRDTPPFTGAKSAGIASLARPIGTATTGAYAGPTFHASPAPSALPIPSFHSKSVPDSPGIKGVQKGKDISSSTEGDSPSQPLRVAHEQLQREESPLDFFFKADREEKERARSASSNQNTATGPFQPPEYPPKVGAPPSAASVHHPRHGSSSRGSTSGIFAMELDGPSSSNGRLGPAFSTPYSERINAALSAQNSRRPPAQASQDSQQSIDRSAALKAYLFSQPAASSESSLASNGSPASNPLGNHQNVSKAGTTKYPGYPAYTDSKEQLSMHESMTTNIRKASGYSSGLRKEVTSTETTTILSEHSRSTNLSQALQHRANTSYASPPAGKFATPSPPRNSPSHFGSSDGRGAELKGMEDNLRKILKLDSPGRVLGANQQ